MAKKNKSNKDEHLEAFNCWLKTKSIIISVIGAAVVAAVLLYFIVQIPYQVHYYFNMGPWGVLVGGLALFITVNIPIGIISTLMKMDEDDIWGTERPCLIIIGLIMVITYGVIYFPIITD